MARRKLNPSGYGYRCPICQQIIEYAKNGRRHANWIHSLVVTTEEVRRTWEQAKIPDSDNDDESAESDTCMDAETSDTHCVLCGPDQPMPEDDGVPVGESPQSRHVSDTIHGMFVEAREPPMEGPASQNNVAQAFVDHPNIAVLDSMFQDRLPAAVKEKLAALLVDASVLPGYQQVLGNNNTLLGLRGTGYEPFPNYTIMAFFIMRAFLYHSYDALELVAALLRNPEFKSDEVPTSIENLKKVLEGCLPTLQAEAKVSESKYKGTSLSLLEVLQRRFMANPRVAEELRYTPTYVYEDRVKPFENESIATGRVYTAACTADKFHNDPSLTVTVKKNGPTMHASEYLCRGDYVMTIHNENGELSGVRVFLIHHFANVSHVADADPWTMRRPGERRPVPAIVGYPVRCTWSKTSGDTETYKFQELAQEDIDWSRSDGLTLVHESDACKVLEHGDTDMDIQHSKRRQVFSKTLNKHTFVLDSITTHVKITLLPTPKTPIRREYDTREEIEQHIARRKLFMELFKDGAVIHSFEFRGIDSCMIRLANSPYKHLMCPLLNLIFSMYIPPKGKRGKNEQAIYEDLNGLCASLIECVNRGCGRFLFDAGSNTVELVTMLTGNLMVDYPAACEITNTISGRGTGSRPVGDYRLMGMDAPNAPSDMPDDALIRKSLVLERTLYQQRRDELERPPLPNGKAMPAKKVPINGFQNPFLEVADVENVDVFKFTSLGVKHASYQNFANQRVHKVVWTDLLSVYGVEKMALSYAKYSNNRSMSYCSLAESQSQMITQHGRIKFKSVDAFLNVMHALYVDLFHPDELDTISEFKLMFRNSVVRLFGYPNKKHYNLEDAAANNKPTRKRVNFGHVKKKKKSNRKEDSDDEDDDAHEQGAGGQAEYDAAEALAEDKRRQFQTQLIEYARLTVRICRLVNSSVVSESNLEEFKTMTREIDTVAGCIEKYIKRITVVAEDDDAERRPVDLENDDEQAVVADGQENERGHAPTTSLLGTPSVRLLFSESMRLIRENGSMVYRSEDIGEFNQGVVETGSKKTSSREDTLHAEVMNTENGRGTFLSLLADTPFVDIPKPDHWQPNKPRPESTDSFVMAMASATNRVDYFVASAKLGLLMYPGSKLRALGDTKDYTGPLGPLKKLLQEKVSPSFFFPPGKKTLKPYSADRVKHNTHLFILYTMKDQVQKLLTETVGWGDADVMEAGSEAKVEAVDRLVKELHDVLTDIFTDLDAIVAMEIRPDESMNAAVRALITAEPPTKCVSSWKTLTGSKVSITAGQYIIIKFYNDGDDAARFDLAQYVSTVMICPTSMLYEARSATVLVSWLEPNLDDDGVHLRDPRYGYPLYHRGSFGWVPLSSIVRCAHAFPANHDTAATLTNERRSLELYKVQDVILNELAHYSTVET